jgi:hypothetical protein
MEQTNKQKLGWTAKKIIFPDECTKRMKKRFIHDIIWKQENKTWK